ncbi:unnamed protein product (macronuclear) [Paramecium tetraurelia]|uniref:Uncharacterized protein n=1 Tax=Paramecium tetraurelia TaxID=5888 RepID=A0CTE0_PARTE|nr:uncharacterized protein GSPATT00010291001 [Paramecium tetraurelia]CAK74057.1 unnamed protein product [Paramecium tetraurelia]|eukprot:XP_001441454.1 hypothetical protein (macronuclear) [Paramecium tetraurelia strain d4-2]
MLKYLNYQFLGVCAQIRIHIVLIRISNIMLSTIVSPIWYQVAIYYNTNDYDLNWLVGWYFIGPILFCFPFNAIIIYNYGLSQILSSICSSIGLWILVSVKRDFQLGMLGFIFLGIGEAFCCQTPLCIKLNKKQTYQKFGLIRTNVYLLHLWDNMQIMQDVQLDMWFHFIIFLELQVDISKIRMMKLNLMHDMKILYLLMLFLLLLLSLLVSYRSSPHVIPQIRFKLEILFGSHQKRFVLIREHFWILFQYQHVFYCIISLVIGVSWCYIVLFGNQQYYVDYTPEEICLTYVTFSVGQLIAALICSYKLNSQSQKGLQQTYDTFIKFTISLGFLFLVAENLTFEFLPFQLVIIVNLFIGAGLGGVYSILLESLMEKHYPVQELAISSLLVVVACALSYFILMISIIPQFLTYGFYISCFFMIPSFCYILVFYKTKYTRFEYES